MRKNEFNSLEDFTSQYTGVWDPSNSHWYGLDFAYEGDEYRFHTWSMYNPENTILPDGRIAMFGLYKKTPTLEKEYTLLGEYATMDDVLLSTVIKNHPFKDVIIDKDTELLGQD